MPILFSTEVKKDPAAKSKSKRAFGRQYWLSILLKNTQYDNNDDDVQVCPGGLARQGEEADLRIPRGRGAASEPRPRLHFRSGSSQEEPDKEGSLSNQTKPDNEGSLSNGAMRNLCRIAIWCEMIC